MRQMLLLYSHAAHPGVQMIARRQTMVAIPPGERLVAGVDLGGTNVRTCIARADGAILARARTPTPADDGPAAVVERIVAGVRELAQTAGVAVRQLAGVGVGAP